ncbi:MAG: helix-hairpin-helix domain-containing protein, partial [Desulfobulbus sp.]
KTKRKSKSKAKSSAKSRKSSKSKSIKRTGKVNINTADAKTLTEFTGIGPVTAKKIIAYRRKNGKFKSAADLLNVKGIGEKTLKKMKPQLKF